MGVVSCILPPQQVSSPPWPCSTPSSKPHLLFRPHREAHSHQGSGPLRSSSLEQTPLGFKQGFLAPKEVQLAVWGHGGST